MLHRYSNDRLATLRQSMERVGASVAEVAVIRKPIWEDNIEAYAFAFLPGANAIDVIDAFVKWTAHLILSQELTYDEEAARRLWQHALGPD